MPSVCRFWPNYAKGLVFEVELLYGAKQKNMSILKIPVNVSDTRKSVGRKSGLGISFVFLISVFIDLILLRAII